MLCRVRVKDENELAASMDRNDQQPRNVAYDHEILPCNDKHDYSHSMNPKTKTEPCTPCFTASCLDHLAQIIAVPRVDERAEEIQ